MIAPRRLLRAGTGRFGTLRNPAAWVSIAALLIGAIAADAEAADPRPYWIFLASSARDRAASTLAISPRAMARLEKTGNPIADDPRNRAVSRSELAPLLERKIAIRHSSRWLRAVSALLSEKDLRDLAADPRVLEVRPVGQFVRDPEPVAEIMENAGAAGSPASKATDDDPSARDPRTLRGPDYGDSWEQLEMLGIPELHRRGYSGRGVLVAIFDTGFYKTHQSLRRLALVAERDFACGDNETQYQPGETCLPREADSHGTYTWSALGGFAPGTLMGAAYRSSFALARTEEIGHEVHLEEDHYIAALEWADSLGADIVSSSLGYRRFTNGDFYGIDQLDGETVPITRATQIAAERGILVVTAMGNAGPDSSTLVAPADGKKVVAVGAVDFAGAVASFSSRGPTGDGRIKPDVTANGDMTACATADTPGSYGRVDGTSLATPLIAGLAAIMLEAHPAWTPDSLLEAFHSSGDHAEAPSNVAGWGVAHGPRALRFEPGLTVDGIEWMENAGIRGTIDWGDHGRLIVWLRNDASLPAPAGNAWIGPHDNRLHPADSSAVARNLIVPGGRDSIGFDLWIDNQEEFDVASLFLEIESEGFVIERKVPLAIPRPYSQVRFDAEPDPTGVCTLSWDVRLLETASLGDTSFRLYREDASGTRVPLQEGNLSWWLHEWTDRPPAPGVYRYWIEIKILTGLYTSFEGPREVVILPVVDFAGNPISGPVPLTVSFTDESTSTPVSWSWSFGDGGTAAIQNPTHTYSIAGMYTVSLTATNGSGESDVATKTGYISVDELAAMGRPYPNPIHGGLLSIRLDWSRSDPPRIDVFDPAGRRIRVLTGPPSVSASPTLEWDLKDEGGRPAPSGLYLLRLPGVGSARTLIVR